MESRQQVRAALESRRRRGQRSTVEHKGKTKVFDLARSAPEGAACRARRTAGSSSSSPSRMGPEGSLRPEALVRAGPDALGSLDACRRRA